MASDDDAFEFWSAKWSEGQIGFHEGVPNDLLVAHVGVLERERGPLRVLAPLAGKAEDLAWLAARGHEVVGVEFVAQAIEAFFAARRVEPRRHALGSFEAFTADRVTMVCADFFALTAEALGRFDAIYDRAGLVAVDPSLRTRYVEVCRSLCRGDARGLLVALAYDQSKAEGPPWSLDGAMVQSLWPGATPLQTRQVGTAPRLAEAGVPHFEETAYAIEVSPSA